MGLESDFPFFTACGRVTRSLASGDEPCEEQLGENSQSVQIDQSLPLYCRPVQADQRLGKGGAGLVFFSSQTGWLR